MQRLEARLDANEPRPLPTWPPRPDPDPPYSMPWDGQSPSWMPTGIPTPSTAAAIPSLSLSTMVPQIPQYVDSYWQPPIMDGNQVAYGGQQLGTTRMTTEMVPSSWDLPATRMETRGPSSPSSPYEFDPILGRPRTSWDLPRPRIAPESCSNPSDWNYSDPYAYDSPFGRPLTSWDLPRPRIESYGGGGSSQYEYGASRNHGGGSYSPYSNYGGGYSGGRYANEPNPYVSPPPPPREGYYVSAREPNPPSYTPPQQPRGSSCSLTTPNDAQYTTSAGREGERGVSERVEEENKGAEAAMEANVIYERARLTTPLGSEEEFIGDEKWDRNLKDRLPLEEIVQEKEDDRLEDMVFVQKEVFSIVEASDLTMTKEEDVAVMPIVEKKNGKRKGPAEGADTQDVEKENSSVVLPCKGDMFDYWRKGVFLEVSRRLLIFGIYALEEVYKDCIAILRTRWFSRAGELIR